MDYSHAFVIMPFGEPWPNEVFSRMIEPAVRAVTFDCTRGGRNCKNWEPDNGHLGPNHADRHSVANVNVFYELGFTHALGKDTLLLKQKDARLPADFGGAHYYEYDLDRLDAGRDALRADLEKWAASNRVAAVKALYLFRCA